MANWNLSVDIRGHGNDLAQALKSSAKHARTLGNAARTAKSEVRDLGQAAETVTRHIRALGREARTTGRRLDALGTGARTAARQLGRYGDAARTANRHVNTLGDNSRTTGRQLARMSGQIDTAVRDLLRLATAAQRASTHMNGLGPNGVRGLRQFANESSNARKHLASLAMLLTGGAFAIGGAEIMHLGGEYQQAMNAFGATTGATQMQMQRAAATANQLGNDLKLPGATAADAAEGMVELAKAGFRTDQAISSTRASLTLASAAQVNAADSAKYLGDMMDQFGMGADQAGSAADTLAATANAASGEIIDIYYAMKYAGPVAHGLGLSMQETAAAVGMLGKAGILGQTAGTTLRGMMANLAAPTPQMISGLKAMNIQAWDAQGNFKGLRYVIDGLSKAQHNMTQQDFAAAVKKSMGKPAMSGAIALAHQGVDSFDNLMAAVSDTGAAAEIAAAKGKGLAGAMLQLKTQAKQTGLTIYQGMAPGMEFLTRGITAGLSKATPKIESFFKYFNDAAVLFGPDLAAAAREEFGGIADAVGDMAGGFKDLGGDALAAFLHLVLSTGQMVIDVLKSLAAGVEPVVNSLGDLTSEGSTVSSTLDLIVTAVDMATSAIGALSGVLGPIGQVVGSLVSAFGGLPGPIQQFVLAALLIRRIQGPMNNLASTVSGRVTGAFRSLGQQMAVQRSLAAASGQSISRYGAAFAVLQTRVPVIGRMGSAFRTAQGQATGFAGTLRGIGAASASAARSMGSGLMGALGGPWGLAITAATVGLGFLASKQQQAAQAAAEHQQQIASLSSALRESNGVVDESVRAIATQNLMQTKVKTTLDGQQRLVDLARKAKVPMSSLVDAYTNQGTSLSRLQRELKATADVQKTVVMDPETGQSTTTFTVQGRAAEDLRSSLGGLSGDFKKAASDAAAYNEGVKGASDGVSAYDRLKDAVGALADKTRDADTRTRALREALDLLSGGSVSLQAAQARVNEAITNANEAMAAGIVKADGWGKSLLKSNGQLDTTTKNGQQLFSTFNTIADGASNAAIAAYDFAQSQGKTLPESLAAARGEMKKSRDAVVDLNMKYGMTKTQAEGVADSVGLIPGQVSILLQTEGVDTTLAELLAVQAQFEQWPDKKTIKVDALSEDAKKKLEDLGYKIELIPGTREYKITASTKDARDKLDGLIGEMSKVKGKDVKVNAETQNAVTQLEAVKKKVASTKGKTVTMGALTGAAKQHLEDLGFKIRSTKGKNVVITVPTGSQKAAVAALAGAINSLHNKSVTVTTYFKQVKQAGGSNQAAKNYAETAKADGGVVDYYAGGGIRRPDGSTHFAGGSENHVAEIAPAGSWRVWAEPETHGEGYVPFAASKRPRSRAITEEIVRRLGGDPDGIAWHADGGLTGGVQSFASGGFTYTPSEVPALGGLSDPKARVDKLVASLRDAWKEYDAAVKELSKAKTGKQKTAARRKVAAEKNDIAEINTALGQSKYAKAPTKFDLSNYMKQLDASVKATQKWRANLAKIAARGGQEVADLLESMGEEGYSLVARLAGASTKHFNEIVANLQKVAGVAKATLADYTKQLNATNKVDATFQANLIKLAGQGYGALASQLAAQNDEAAQQVAADAVKSKSGATAANTAAKTQANALTDEQLEQIVAIIAAIATSNTGIHAVAATTGLGEDEIIATATKAQAQIKSSLGSRSTRFLADLGRANQHLSYADGGIRAGMYASRGGIVRFAEPETHGEAYIPLGPSKRRTALPVLADVAHRFGVGLTDAQAARPVVIVRGGGDTHVTVTPVRTGATASDIGAQVGRSVRRARRGGVAARAA